MSPLNICEIKYILGSLIMKSRCQNTFSFIFSLIHVLTITVVIKSQKKTKIYFILEILWNHSYLFYLVYLTIYIYNLSSILFESLRFVHFSAPNSVDQKIITFGSFELTFSYSKITFNDQKIAYRRVR